MPGELIRFPCKERTYQIIICSSKDRSFVWVIDLRF